MVGDSSVKRISTRYLNPNNLRLLKTYSCEGFIVYLPRIPNKAILFTEFYRESYRFKLIAKTPKFEEPKHKRQKKMKTRIQQSNSISEKSFEGN